MNWGSLATKFLHLSSGMWISDSKSKRVPRASVTLSFRLKRVDGGWLPLVVALLYLKGTIRKTWLLSIPESYCGYFNLSNIFVSAGYAACQANAGFFLLVL